MSEIIGKIFIVLLFGGAFVVVLETITSLWSLNKIADELKNIREIMEREKKP